MNPPPGPVVVINPLESEHPTGMGLAGDGVRSIFQAAGRDATPPWVSRLFREINDGLPIPPLRTIIRLFAVQIVPLFLPRALPIIFTAHQAPLWKTGRHFVVIHDLISLAYPFQHRMQTFFFLLLLPRVLAACEHLVVISGATKSELARHLPKSKASMATIIPSYLERLERLQPSHFVTLKQRLAHRRFLFVGARYRHKNLDYALAALVALRQSGEAVELVITGCLPSLWWQDHGGLEKLVAEGWVTILEYASEEQLCAEYERCTALLYTSQVEGMGLPPLEAMALGAPVICSDIPAARETCGAAAFYVDPARPEEMAALAGRILRGELTAEILAQGDAAKMVLPRFARPAITELWNQRVR